MVITTIRDDLGFFNETKARRLSKNTLKKYAQKFHNFKCWIKERPALKAQCFDHDGTNFYLQNGFLFCSGGGGPTVTVKQCKIISPRACE